MQIIELQQGTPEWHAHRASHFNASDAPAMLGCSPHKTRGQLLHELHTGIAKEASSFVEERVFAPGHRFEALARSLAEQIVGEDLYPVVGTSGKLSASFDGLTMCEAVGFEHKTLNDELQAALNADDGITRLPKAYRVQMEQQLLVSGAERVLFMASKWNGDTLMVELHDWYESDPALRAEIVAGWAQFEKDLAAYVPPEVAPAAPVGRAPDTLPALHIVLRGEVSASNLAEFKDVALTAIRSVNRDLKTDQDFADSAKARRWCSDIESRVAAAKEHALSQTATIDMLFRTMDEVSAEAREVRLSLEKLEKARTEARKGEIVAGGVKALADHIAALNVRLGRPYMPAVPVDFGGAIKGMRSFDSMQNAVDTALANAKIAANAVADRIDVNLKHLAAEAGEYLALFPDVASIAVKQADDFAAVVQFRIADQRAKEQKKADDLRVKIAEEERVKAEAAVQAPAAEAPAAAPAATPAHTYSRPFSTVLPLRTSAAEASARVAPAADAVPSLSIGQIGTRLGFTLPAAFLQSLGFEPTRHRGSVLFHESDFPLICRALIDHIESALELQAA